MKLFDLEIDRKVKGWGRLNGRNIGVAGGARCANTCAWLIKSRHAVHRVYCMRCCKPALFGAGGVDKAHSRYQFGTTGQLECWCGRWLNGAWCRIDAASEIFVGIFRLCGDNLSTVTVYPKGISVSNKYKVTFDNDNESVILSGYDIKNNGIKVNVTTNLNSELIILQKEI